LTIKDHLREKVVLSQCSSGVNFLLLLLLAGSESKLYLVP
jgi:hypothetical protein